jgi:ankyrin repeat protein
MFVPPISRLVWLSVVIGSWATSPAGAQEPKKKADPPKDEVETLIDRLVEIDRQDTGYSGSTSGNAFLPLNQSGPHTMLLGQLPQVRSDTMKTLVKLGARAVPKLLEHLADERPTQITLTHDLLIGGLFVQDDTPKKKDDIFAEYGTSQDRHTVAVGDLCYVALGQIVNRHYRAVRYQPTAIVIAVSLPRSKKLREELVKEWGGLTPAKHRESLVRDMRTGDARESAALRLGYYYPDALEGPALAYLSQPFYDAMAVQALVRHRLYPATAKDRKALFEEFVAKHGEVARAGIRWYLFNDLESQEAEEEGRRSSRSDPPLRGRECLVELFGLPKTVKGKDRTGEPPTDDYDLARLTESLRYFRNTKLDRAVRDLLPKIENSYVVTDLYEYLVGRGFDADLEADLKRRLPKLEDARERRDLQKFEPKLGWIWLHTTVDLGVAEMVEAALRDRGDPNARGRDGRTPLHIAAAAGADEIVAVLLRAKADPNVADGKTRLPVELASHKYHPPVVRRLVTGGSRVPDVFTAAIVGATDRMAALLREQPDRRGSRNEGGLTPLHVAAHEGHVETARALLAAGADVKAVDLRPATDGELGHSDGYTPLHLAAMGGKKATAELLIDQGADVNAVDKRGTHTPLHVAAWVGNAELVRLLLARKADRNAKGFRDRTPLDLALEKKHDAVIKLLQER